MCAVPCGVNSTVVDVQYRGGYHDACGGYHDACGGYHEYHGGVQYNGGTQMTKDFFPIVLNTPLGTHDIMSIVGDTILCNLSTVGEIMMHVGDIMSTVGVFSTMGVLK